MPSFTAHADVPFFATLAGRLTQRGRRGTSVASRRGAVPQTSGLGEARRAMVQLGPDADRMGPMVSLQFERVEALELLGMTLAHLNDVETRGEVSPRAALLMAIRDKLALALREEP